VGTITVLLSGRLKVDGYGRSHPANGDGTLLLSLEDGGTAGDVVRSLDVPTAEVALTMINGDLCPLETAVQPGDRVILIPADVAALWRSLGRHNLGADSVFDFSEEQGRPNSVTMGGQSE
jgi:hypothetical protein